MQLTLIGIAAL